MLNPEFEPDPSEVNVINVWLVADTIDKGGVCDICIRISESDVGPL